MHANSIIFVSDCIFIDHVRPPCLFRLVLIRTFIDVGGSKTLLALNSIGYYTIQQLEAP